MALVRPSKPARVSCHIIPSPKSVTGLDGDWLDLGEYEFRCQGYFPEVAAVLRGLFAFASQSSKVFELKQDRTLGAEEYRIAASEGGIVVSSSTEAGACYAVETLKQIHRGNFIQAVTVHDYPSLPIRGFHTNLQSFCQNSADDVLRFIDMFGKFKLNAYLIEYNSRFPFDSHPDLRGADVFAREDIQAFEERAKKRHVELIPLLQCIGHNEYIGRLEQYAHLFEPAGDGKTPAQFCPNNPDSFELFKELATEIMAAHPGGRYLHIGGDETRSLGACPKCAAAMAEKGKARLYLDYVNKVIDWVIQQGRIPIIWDDMLSHFIGSVSDLDHRVVIMYWDYWTTSMESPIFVARPVGHGVISDISYKESGYAGVEEPERTVIQKFTAPVDVMEVLKDDRIADFARRYLGNGLPRTFTAFPFLDFFQAEGFTVMGAPSTLGNFMDDIYGLPNYARFRKNIRAFAKKCQQKKAAGLMTSSWYNFPSEMVDLGIIDTAQNAWTDAREAEV